MSFLTPVKKSFVFDATTVQKDITINERGDFNYLFLTTPNFTNNVNAKIQIIDQDGDVIWDMTEARHDTFATSQQGRGSSIRYNFDFDIPIYRGWILRCILSGPAGGTGGTVLLKTFIKANK